MSSLFSGGNFERSHGASGRVDAGHYVLDGAVLAGRVHALQHDEERVLLLGVKQVVEFGQLLCVLLLDRQTGIFVVKVGGIVWVSVREAELFARAGKRRVPGGSPGTSVTRR